jgi:hypothetical protein
MTDPPFYGSLASPNGSAPGASLCRCSGATRCVIAGWPASRRDANGKQAMVASARSSSARSDKATERWNAAYRRPPAIFLTEEANKIIDATFGNEATLQRQASEWRRSAQRRGTMIGTRRIPKLSTGFVDVLPCTLS